MTDCSYIRKSSYISDFDNLNYITSFQFLSEGPATENDWEKQKTKMLLE